MHLTTSAKAEQEIPGSNTDCWNDHIKEATAELTIHPFDEVKDHFIQRNGEEFAGTHVLLDLWDARHLDDLDRIEQAMREIVDVCGATLLHIHLHHFNAGGGVSGVAVLAESHISVHTWPERDYAAFDVFMCGDAQPENAIPVLKRAFFPRRIEVREELRGRVQK